MDGAAMVDVCGVRIYESEFVGGWKNEGGDVVDPGSSMAIFEA